MIIKKIPIEKINPAKYNPRIDLQAGDPEYEKLKASIETFGYIDPLIWNERTGNLVGGHQRFKILLEENPTEIKVSVVNLDEAREKALNLALNKIGGDWDDYKLQELLGELSQTDINMELKGFDENELSDLLEEIEPDGSTNMSLNQELSLDDYNEENFEHCCPKCGFTFND